MTTKAADLEGLIHRGPRTNTGPGKWGNEPPEGDFWVIAVRQTKNDKSIERFVLDVDDKGNPTFTESINECAKFSRWTNVKKFWRGTSMRLPKETPQGTLTIEKQSFGKGLKAPQVGK